jgi:hypothetical protein
MSIFWNKKTSEDKKQEGDEIKIGSPLSNIYTSDTNTKTNINSAKKIGTNSSPKVNDMDLENVHIRNDVLLEIATFLSRRWSDSSESTIHISREGKISTNLEKKRITLPGLDYFYGNVFQKYRQWRTLLWYESVRLKYSFKIFDTDRRG